MRPNPQKRERRRKMAYKDKIYDITALEMAKRMELFLNKYFKATGVGAAKLTLGKKIDKFASKRGGKISHRMRYINEKRRDIVHPTNLKPVLDFKKFRELQNVCFQLEKSIREQNLPIRIGEVLSMLPYDMGNAGDIIKHGLLAELLEWRFVDDESGALRKQRGSDLRVADTFGGCPWDNVYNSAIEERVKTLSDTALGRAQNRIKDGMYYGSAFLMNQVAENCKCKARIEVSDNNPDAHCNWINAKIICNSIEWINLPRNGKDVRQNNGYRILDDTQNPGRYDLILIDPFSEFLRDEFYLVDPGKDGKCFRRILDLAKKHPHLFIAVFILDMSRTNSVGRSFASFKREHLVDWAFSLRCPKIPKSEVSGESRFDSEILLISQQIRNGGCKELRKRLEKFAELARNALDANVKFNAIGGKE